MLIPESKDDLLDSPPAPGVAALLALRLGCRTPVEVGKSSTLTVRGCCTEGEAARKARAREEGEEARNLPPPRLGGGGGG